MIFVGIPQSKGAEEVIVSMNTFKKVGDKIGGTILMFNKMQMNTCNANSKHVMNFVKWLSQNDEKKVPSPVS